MGLVDQVATLLANCVHHHLIFPKLDEWGYNPGQCECEGISKQMDAAEITDLTRLANAPQLTALFAMVYARVQLFCNEASVVARVDRLYSSPSLAEAKLLGSQVASIIRECPEASMDAVHSTLRRCVAILRLSNDIEIAINKA